MIGALDTEGLRGLLRGLAGLSPARDDAERIDRIRLLEQLKSAAAAVQAQTTAEFAASQRAAQAAAGVPLERVGRGIAHQVGLARRMSPFHAQRYVGWATILTSELPFTFRALLTGRTSEYRALLVARETAWLSRHHRARVDEFIGPRLEQLGERRLQDELRALAYRLDPQGFLDRIKGAEKDRRVTIRPAPDTMSRLTGFLPVAQGVAAYAALRNEADRCIAAGDSRSRGQIMADTLVERVTGQSRAADVPLEINLIMTDRTLLGHGADPAVIEGYGPVPAERARQMVSEPGPAIPMWLRRLYTDPDQGALVAMESRRRLFTAGQRRLLRSRDRYCRTPWCEAPIRHFDHVLPAETGGATSLSNGQGLCESCNHAKQAPGWQMTVVPAVDGHTVEVLTPTGHRYRSRAPDPPGTPADPLERQVAAALRRRRAA